MKKANRVIYSILILVMGLSVTACGKKATVPEESETVVETTVDPEEKFRIDKPIELEEPTKEVIGTDADGGKTGLTADGEIAYDAGHYGDLGKSVFDNLAGAWVKGNITDEPALRKVMEVTYGDFNNKENLTQEILAMPRNTQPTQVAQETQSADTGKKAETKAQTQSEKAPTKVETAQPVTQETAQPEGDYWSSLTPEQRAELEAEQQRRTEEALAHPAKVEDGGVGTPINADDAIAQWNWN